MTDQLGQIKSALADRYSVDRELGSGGMATVYLAEDLKHRRQVAIKVLRPDLAAVLGTERFLREIETAARLRMVHHTVGKRRSRNAVVGKRSQASHRPLSAEPRR